MKKITVILLIVLATTIMAQSEVGKQVQYGVKGGISFNHFLGDIPIELDPRLYTGFSAGVFANYKVNDNFSIQPEVIYSRKGSNFEEFKFESERYQFAQIFRLDLYINTDWIEIPILGMYQISDEFTLFGGPYIGFYLNGKVVAEPSIGGILGIDWDYDIDSKMLRLPDYGIVIGGKYKFNDKLAIQARWVYGIQDLADDVIVTFLDDDFIVINNSSFQLQFDFTI